MKAIRADTQGGRCRDASGLGLESGGCWGEVVGRRCWKGQGFQVKGGTRVRLKTNKLSEARSGPTVLNVLISRSLYSLKNYLAAQEPLFMWVININICCVISQS